MVWDKNEQHLYDINYSVLSDSFYIYNSEDLETEVGLMLHTANQPFTDIHTFTINFPNNIDITKKVLLIGASIDVFNVYKYYFLMQDPNFETILAFLGLV